MSNQLNIFVCFARSIREILENESQISQLTGLIDASLTICQSSERIKLMSVREGFLSILERNGENSAKRYLKSFSDFVIYHHERVLSRNNNYNNYNNIDRNNNHINNQIINRI